MKAKRLLFIVIVIFLASGMNAQFYDGPDEIYFYLEESRDGKTTNNPNVRVFNFDGQKACELACESPKEVQRHLKEDTDFYGKKVETTKYELEYSTSERCYKCRKEQYTSTYSGDPCLNIHNLTYKFSSDRKSLNFESQFKSNVVGATLVDITSFSGYRKVDKSYFLNGFFGEGRQRR